MRQGSLGATALAGLITAGLALAPAAFAGTIRYDIAPDPSYRVDNEQGIVKISYAGCVTAGQRQTINFTMVTNASATATVGFKVLREEGEEPVSEFNPSTVALEKGTEQSFAVVYSYTLTTPTDKRTTFRFKLDPDNGAGLGEGPGVMVTIPCVLAAPPASAGSPGETAGQGGAAGQLTAPTAGVLPPAGSVLAAREASCIAVPRRVRLRAGERTVIDVIVNASGQGIQNSLVRITLPGGRQVSHRTGSNGVARFTVRPRRSGRAVIQSDVCFGARRVAVAAVRNASARGRARFTG